MTKLKYKFLYYSFLLFVTFSLLELNTAFAQREIDSLYILDAVILTSDSLLPVVNAHVISKFNRWGTISNKQGRFKLYVQDDDSVLITSIGFSPLILQMDAAILSSDNILEIKLPKDTITINEVIIRAYFDYPTMKQIVINMQPIDLSQFYPDWTNTGLLYLEPRPMSFKGPIQALYDVLNRSARLQRKLIRNRKEYNEIMRQMGRYLDTIPAKPEHMQESPN
ncbi:MAG: hypothetical protein CL661_05955 [Bacteroidetes bacterium]|nr:hypothetical protein [Bacteroidota bacterium]|tara:strand:- start:2473 stop:3141 length:669 start_codon:yes stop_codon:yes gene_type:complete